MRTLANPWRSCALLLVLLSTPGHADNILWVGAHPDDEHYVAGTWAHLCVSTSNSCFMVTLTRGENGSCELSGGCHPSIEAVRVAEMEDAADLFDSTLGMGFLDDVGLGQDGSWTLNYWSNQAGSYAVLLDDMKDIITDNNIDSIITFHPDMGVSCHGAHRAAGQLVLDAVDDLNFDPTQVLLVTQLQGISSTTPAYMTRARGFPSNPDEITAYVDAYWGYLISDIEIHASQYAYPLVRDLVSASPSSHRREYYLYYDDFASSSLCD